MKSAEIKIKRMKLEDLRPHPKNPRIHPEKGSELWNTLAGSLSHDYFDPIVFNTVNKYLVSGHLRVKVLTDLGYTHADCVLKEYEEKIHLARMLAANKLIGSNLNDQLKDILLHLDEGDINVDLTGYTEGEIETLMTQIHKEDEAESNADGGESEGNKIVVCPKCKHEFSVLKEIKT